MFNLLIWLSMWLPCSLSRWSWYILTACFMVPSLGIEPHHSLLSGSTSDRTLSTGHTNYVYSHFYQLNWSIIFPFKQTLFCLEYFQLLLQISIHFVCNYPLKWQCLLAGCIFLWMTIFAFLAMVTRISLPSKLIT